MSLLSVNRIISEVRAAREHFRKCIMAALCLAGFFFLASPSLFSQSAGDYRTAGNVTFASASNWQSYNGSSWVVAATAPTTASGLITIRSGDNATVTSSLSIDQLEVLSGATLSVNSGRTLTIADDPGTNPDLDVYGTVVNSGTISPIGTIRFNSSSVYNHAQDGGSIPFATWSISSDIEITGIISATGFSGGLSGQTFGNFIWNSPAQVSNFFMETSFAVGGNFIVTSTGAPDHIIHSLRMSNTSTGYTLNVGGNFIVENSSTFKMNNNSGSCILNITGNLNVSSGFFTIVTGSANSTVNVEGNVNLTGGNLIMKEDANSNTGTINLKGNFTQAGTDITIYDGPGRGLINFNGSSVQIYSNSSGSTSNAINYSVANGSVLDMGSDVIEGSSGTFTLNVGAGLITAHPEGISTTPGTGCIRVTGTKTFNAGANITFNGSVAQETGNGVPTVHNLTFDNPAGVTLTNSITVNGTLNLIQGVVTTGGDVLQLANNTPAALSYSSGFVNGNLERFINTLGTGYYFPVGVSQAQTARFDFTALTAGSLIVSYVESDPNGTGLPLYDTDGQKIGLEFKNGYWTALANNGLTSSNYIVALDGTGFNDPDIVKPTTRIITRTGFGDWSINGVPGVINMSVVERNACNGIDNSTGTQFGLGTGNCFSFSSQPSSFTGCEGDNASFSVSVGSAVGSVLYQWLKDGAPLIDGGNISGATSSSLSISSVAASDEGEYTCQVTDDCGSQVSQGAKLLIVRPGAVLGYKYQKQISIDHTKVSGSTALINFPVLISITTSPNRDGLRSILNGGHVENANGYDIIFTDADYHKLDHQIESYDAVTGNLIAWVRIPVLSASANTNIRILYGNPAITLNPSLKTVWDSNFRGVWHLNGTDFTDATLNGNDGANSGSTDVAGKIGNGKSFNGSSDYIDAGENPSLLISNSITVSAWVYRSSSGNGHIINMGGGWSDPGYSLFWYGSDVRVEIQPVKTIYDVSGPSNNSWHHLAFTWDINRKTIETYIDGTVAGPGIAYDGPIGTPAQHLMIGKNANQAGFVFDGIIDEARVQSLARSPEWISTEYNNQNSPSSFFSVGSEATCSVYSFSEICAGTAITYSVPNTPGHSYSWLATGGTITGIGNSVSITWNASGPYSLQLSETDGSCSGSSPAYSLTVKQPAVAQTIVKSPDVTDVCSSGAVSATFSGGSGGVLPTDIYESSVDGGSTWVAYTPGANLSSLTPGLNRIRVRTHRQSAGSGCDPSPYNTVTWNVVDQPQITSQPAGATHCYNETHTLTTVVTGGTLISYQWQVSPDGTGSWTNVGTNSPSYTTPAITGSNYYKVIISSTGSGCSTPLESNVAGVLLESVAPSVTCSGPITQNVDAASCTASVIVPAVTYSDNCSVSSLTWAMTGTTVANSPATGINQIGTHTFNSGVTNILFTAKDAADNQSTCTFSVTITDNIDPSITCTGDIVTTTSADGIGNCTTTAILGTPVTADNCSVSTVIAMVSGTAINPATYNFPAGVTTVTWTVTDVNGRTANCDQKVTVTDNENPSISCPANITHTANSGLCSYTVSAGTPTTADNCGVATTVGTRNDSGALTDPYPVGTTTIHWVVTDVHGNTNTCDQTVTVTDNEVPTIACPANITHAADAGLCSYSVAVGTPTTSDNCAVAGTVGTRSDSQLLTAVYPVGTTTIHWVVTDVHGNTNTCDQTVTVTDNEVPTITCPANITHTADAGLCSYSVAVGTPTTSDNCGVATTVGTRNDSGALTDPYPVGITTIHWVVTDVHGNTNTCDQTVTVTDNENPTITCPANITHTADAGLCSYSVAVGTPSTGDNCGVAGVVGTRSDTQLLTAVYPVGTTTIHWVVTDVHGNTNTCDQTVTVTDNENPTITCPANITHTADAGLCSYSVAVGTPTTGDNCGVASVVGTRSDTQLLTAVYPVGTTTIHWVVTDVHGNTNTCDQTVTVTDNENPTITCPANITHTADAGLCSYSVAVGTPTTGDNCGVASVVGTRSDTQLLTAVYPVGTTTIHWVVTDVHGNTNTCDQTVTVTDNENPTITCPANITHTADAGQCSYSVAVGTPTTGDNCGVADVVGTRSDSQLLTAVYPFGTTTIHWVVTDVHGNTNTCDQTVTVTDNENPTITCPANITHTADAGQCSYSVSSGTPTTADNCGIASTVGTRSDSKPLTDPYPVGTTTIHWVVTDVHGNTNTCDQTVTVTDNENPIITCPANITHTADAGLCSYSVAVGTPTTGDNCGVASVVGTRSDSQLLTAVYPVGTTTIHWVVTDVHGNTNTCDQTITVTDNENPIITCPANITHTADAGLCSYSVAVGTPTTGDNCGVASVVGTRSDTQLLTAVYPVGTTTIHWVVTDVHGNTNTCDQTVTVTDNENPTITCPANITHTADAGLCSYSVAVGTPTTGDNCGVASVVGTRSDTQLLTAVYPVGTTTIHWVVTDVHGNTNTCDQTVTVTDNENPIITCPANITHTADAGLCSYSVAVGTPTTGDNCGVASVVGTRSDTQLLTAVYPVGTTTIHWVVTDVHGNTNTCDQTVTVTDNENPTITCPANITHAADAGLCSYSVVVGTPTTSDNCGVATTVGTRSDSGALTDPYPVGITTIHWVVTDVHGNTSTCDQTVTVTDNEVPTIACPANITHTADAGLCSYSVAVGTPTTSDNCGVATTVGTRSDSEPLTDPYPVGTTTIHWVVTDVHGNTNTCDQTVTVTDNEVPTITCLANITHTADASLCSYSVAVGTPTTSDNCGVATTVGTRSDSGALTDPYPVGTTTIHWVVTDVHGNTSTCDQTVTVTDNEVPTIACPANITHTADAGLCSYSVAVGTPTTSDNCGVATTVGTRSDSEPLTDPYPVGTTTIHWVVTDVHGNTNTCDQTVTVTDNEVPTIACPANITHTADAGLCSYSVAVGTPTTGDNCGVAGVVGTRSDSQLLTAVYPVGTTTIHWVVTDVHGNTNTCDQTVTVTDNEVPTITCPANITHTADAGLCSYSVAVGTPTTSDNCGVATTVGTRNDSGALTDPYPVGTTTIHWVVTDIHGNTNTCDQTVTVTDNENPTITCPANITHTADAGQCSYSVAVGTPTTADNCAVASVVGTRDDSQLITAPYPVGTTTIHWVVTDVHGNTNTCDQTVTVTDNENPTITCPTNITHVADAGLCSYTDAVGTPATGDNCGVASVVGTRDDSQLITAPYPVGTTTIHWLVTDVHGNTNSCDQTVIVTDNEAPVITCPADVVVSCDGNTAPAATGNATATDNCTAVPGLVISYSDVSTYSADASSVLHYNYIISRTWRADDLAGNHSECVQKITVHDITSPVISCPPDITIDCEDNNTPAGTGSATATDNCSPSANIVIGYTDVSTYSSDPSNVLHYDYVITRTWKATDVAGNNSVCVQTITVEDNTNPVITCPANTTISCSSDNEPTGTGYATATDNCTPQANITITHLDVSTYSSDPSDILHYNYVITRTWTAKDVNGNTSSCVQIITVNDVTNPVVSCPANRTVNCDADTSPAATGTATATDNCTATSDLSISFSDVTTYDPDPSIILHYNYTITRTWKAVDKAGNTGQCIQIITVRDVINPVITCPVNVTQNCDVDNSPATTGTATATDNCTPVANITITYSDASTYNPDPSTVLHYNYVIIRTWKATDVAGNFASCTQTIAVHDVTKPVIACPADVTVNCTDNTSPAGTGQPVVSDNCAPLANINVTYTDVSTYSSDPSNVFHYNYSITRTWRATDVTGNYIECVQHITVHDVTPPVITCPSNITLNCDGDHSPAAAGTALATDNCAPAANTAITYSDVSTYDADPSNLLHYNYVITRTWVATDIAGNSSSCIQTITIHDVTAPLFTVPADKLICRAADCSFNILVSATGDVTDESDNCQPSGLLNATFTDDVSGIIDCDNVGIILRTWVLTDIAGNSTTKTQTITIEPTPSVTLTNNAAVICDGGTVDIDINSITSSTIPANLRYVITVASSDPAHLGGTASSGRTLLKSDLPFNFTGTLTNSSNSPITVTYTVTPGLNGCSDGPAKTVQVIVNPTPLVVPVPVTQTICNNGSVSVTLGSPTIFTSGAITFNYTVTATGGVTGYTTPVTGLAKDYVINDVLSNPTDVPQTVTYSIIPVSPVGCSSGNTVNVVITVNPTPQVVPSVTTQTICNDSPTNITLGSPSIFSNGVITFRYTVTATGGVTGFTTPVTGLSKDHKIADLLHNPTNDPQTVTYTIFPVSPAGCAEGPSKTVIVTVNPTPEVVPSVTAQAICNDGTTNITLGSQSTFTSGLITFSYTAVATGGLTGFTASATGLPLNSVISDVIHNPTDLPQTVTYRITPISPTGCSDGPVQTVVVTVDPTPQVNVSATTQKICDEGMTSIVFSSPSHFALGVITFSYTVVATGGVTGFTTPVTGLPNNFTLSDVLHNPTNAPQTVTYTIVPVSPAGCTAGPSKTVVITVEPSPQVNPSTLAQIICNNTATNILLTSPSTFTNGVITFNYSVVATGGVTGFTTPVTGLANNSVIADVLNNPTDVPQTVTYTIVPISPECSASDPVKIVTVTVNPTPKVVPVPSSQTICNDGTTNIVLSSPSTFTSGVIKFDYTVVATGGVTGFSTPVNDISKDYVIADVLHNPTDNPQTVTYTITPLSPTGCAAGPSQTVIVTINPTPQVVPSALLKTICNDQSPAITLASPSTFSNGVITFSYTVVATGGVTGFTSPVSGLSKDYVINDILHNPTDSPQTVTYTVVPVSLSGCAAGPSKVIVITVNPTPVVNPSVSSQALCNDGTTNITLASPSVFTSGVITFNYTVVATGGVTGFTTPLNGLPKDHVIADILHNPTDAPQTVTYTITPVSPTGCPAGTPKTVVVTVDPTPQVVPSALAQTICNDQTTNIVLNSPSTFNSGVIKFRYTVAATGGVTGFTTPVTNLPVNHVISDILHNPTDIPQTVTYTIVPVSPAGCADGPSKVVVITVNPTPQVYPSTLTQTICNDAGTNISLTSPSTFTSGVITFSYTVTATGGVTGFTTPVTGLSNNSVITDILHNPSDAPQTVTYIVVPVSPTGCPAGPSKTIVVTVNPTPQVVPSTLSQTICNNGTTNVRLTSPSTFTSGVITFNYTAVATGNVTGFTTPVNGASLNFLIGDVLHNPTDVPQTVTYTVVPVSPTGCPNGPSKVIVVTVNPTPQVVPSTLTQVICNDGTTTIVLTSPSQFSNGIIHFNYTVSATGGVTGFTTPRTGLSNNFTIADVLHNPTDAPQYVTYIVVPVSPAGCASGPSKTIVVSVNPTPRIYPIPANTIQCDSTTTNIVLQSPSTFTSGLISFRYSVSSTGSVTGYTTPVSGLSNNNVIGDKLINSTDQFQSVTYALIPVSPLGCSDGMTRNVNVTVNPTPRAVLANSYPAICYTGTPSAPVTTQVVLNSPTIMTSGSIVFDYSVNVTGGAGVIVGNTSSQTNLSTGYTISYNYQNNSDTIQSVFYNVTPKVSNAICVPGRIVTGEVKVHARPLQSIIVTKPLTCTGSVGLAGLRAVVSKGASPYHSVWDGPVGFHAVDMLSIDNLTSGKYVVKITDNLGCNRKDSISIVPVTARAYISPSVIPPGNYNLSCTNSTDGSILVSVTGGITPPYTYTVFKNDTEVLFTGVFTNNLNLSDPTTYMFYSNLGAGSYTLVIHDVNGCENINRVVFKVPPPIVAVINKSTFSGGFNISCKGYNDGYAAVQNITGGRGTYSYRWYTTDGTIPGPVNTNRIDNITAGTYYLEIKDLLECIQTETVVITEPDGMQLGGYELSKSPDTNTNISCYGGSDGFIKLNITGGSGTYIILWNGPSGFTSTQKDISGLKAGSYTCTVRDLNGCILTPSPSFVLTEPTPLVIAAPVLSVSPDGGYNIGCNSAATGSVTITVSGGSVGNYRYDWSTTNGSGIITGQKDQTQLTAGDYHLLVTDLNNCTANVDVNITQPPAITAIITPTHITCRSAGFDNGSIDLTVSGGVPPYSYQWSNGATTQDISGLTQGDYEVIITDANGCIKKVSSTINLPPTLSYNKFLSDNNGFNVSCNGQADGSIRISLLTGVAPYTYSWTGPDGYTSGLKDIYGLKAGQYQLVITDVNECKGGETITLTEPGPLDMLVTLPSSTAGGFNINCAGDSTGYINIEPINAVSTVSYLWADGIFGQNRSDLPAGTYQVIITDKNNCHAGKTIVLTEPDTIKLNLNITPPFCPDKPDGSIVTNVTGGVAISSYLYRWSDNSSNRDLVNIPSGFYKIVVTDNNGCVARDSVKVDPLQDGCLVLPNIFSPNGDLINDEWNIGMKELYPAMEVKIYNRWSELVWKSAKGYPVPWDGRSNGRALPIDSYHYTIDLHNGSKVIIGNVTIVR